MLKCTKCGDEKPATAEFFPLHNKKKNGLDSWCRACRSAYRKDIRLPPGIAKEEYARAYEARATGVCVICGSSGPVVVDHDHKTGMVRGALCTNCNLGIGHFKDDPELLEYAALYLKGECACGECKPKWGGLPLFACQ